MFGSLTHTVPPVALPQLQGNFSALLRCCKSLQRCRLPRDTRLLAALSLHWGSWGLWIFYGRRTLVHMIKW